MELETMKCPSCGAPVSLNGKGKKTVCSYCGSEITADADEKEDRKSDEVRLAELELEKMKLQGKVVNMEEFNERVKRWKSINWYIGIGIFLLNFIGLCLMEYDHVGWGVLLIILGVGSTFGGAVWSASKKPMCGVEAKKESTLPAGALRFVLDLFMFFLVDLLAWIVAAAIFAV